MLHFGGFVANPKVRPLYTSDSDSSWLTDVKSEMRTMDARWSQLQAARVSRLSVRTSEIGRAHV